MPPIGASGICIYYEGGIKHLAIITLVAETGFEPATFGV